MNCICYECGAILTEDEQYYFEGRCSNCELEWSNRIDAWRHGATDPELDQLYSVPLPTLH